MSISQRIADDLTEALKAGNKDKVSVLRMIKSSMKNREIEKRATLADEDIQAIIMSYVKRSRESIEQFSLAGRTDLAEKERRELSIAGDYLPDQLSEDKMREVIRDVIEEAGASGQGDFGKVMKASMARLKGKADGKVVNKLVKEALEA